MTVDGTARIQSESAHFCQQSQGRGAVKAHQGKTGSCMTQANLKTYGICFWETASFHISALARAKLQVKYVSKRLSLRWQEHPFRSSSTILPPVNLMFFAYTYFNEMDSRYSALHKETKTFWILVWVLPTCYLREPIGYFSSISCFQLADERSAGTAVSLLQERSVKRPFWKLLQLLHKEDAWTWCTEEKGL